MAAMTWADYWWNRVTGPVEVIRNISDCLAEGKCVVINVPGDLPWRHEMRQAVKDSLRSKFDIGDITFRQIDGEELPSGRYDPGEFLLERLARSSDRRSYRPRMGHSVQSYLLEKHVLKNQVVWLKGLNGSTSRLWLSFCEDYHAHSVADGLVVIEARGICPSECGGASFVDLENRVSLSDARLMNSVVISQLASDSTDLWQRYETSLVTHLCGTDVEVTESLVEMLSIKEDDPIAVLKLLSENVSYFRRGSDSPNHVLSICRTNDTNRLKKRIWEAQVEVLYPIVESERLAIIEFLLDDLSDLVCSQTVLQFDVRVENPLELELGTLVYLIGSHRLSVADGLLRDRIHFLRDCRNQIAHMSCCSVGDIARLIDERWDANVMKMS